MLEDYAIRNEHVVEGQKLAGSLLKRLQSDDPRICLIAFAQCFVMAAQACRLKKPHVFDLIKTLWYALNNPEVNSAQEAASRLIVPGNG